MQNAIGAARNLATDSGVAIKSRTLPKTRQFVNNQCGAQGPAKMQGLAARQVPVSLSCIELHFRVSVKHGEINYCNRTKVFFTFVIHLSVVESG